VNDADLYLNEIDLEKYFPPETCRRCGADSCKALVERLRRGEESEGAAPQSGELEGLRTVLALQDRLPRVPQLALPRPGPPGLTRLNDPKDGDPILITGNHVHTQEVLMTVLASTDRPFFLLCADTRGDSLDMAVILGTFTAETVSKALREAGLFKEAKASPLLLPGRAEPLAGAVREAAGRTVEIGPVCAVELPLYYRGRW
jgi:CO dehydrogenase/acetyl-CoA synthase gamma subunit (corrinoid Fe-S protein)